MLYRLPSCATKDSIPNRIYAFFAVKMLCWLLLAGLAARQPRPLHFRIWPPVKICLFLKWIPYQKCTFGASRLPGVFWRFLGPLLWIPLLAAPPCSWLLLTAPGPGYSWLLLAAPDCFGCFWLPWSLLSAAACSCLSLSAPGYSWLLLAAPGRCWLFLAAAEGQDGS